jgi:hypothetical protein
MPAGILATIMLSTLDPQLPPVPLVDPNPGIPQGAPNFFPSIPEHSEYRPKTSAERFREFFIRHERTLLHLLLICLGVILVSAAERARRTTVSRRL